MYKIVYFLNIVIVSIFARMYSDYLAVNAIICSEWAEIKRQSITFRCGYKTENMLLLYFTSAVRVNKLQILEISLHLFNLAFNGYFRMIATNIPFLG